MAPDVITFLNREVRRIGKDQVLVSQTAYTSNITVRALKRGINRDASLDAIGITEYLSCTGEGQFLASHSRPDISADISLAQRQKPTYHDLAAMYEILSYVKKTQDNGIVINPIPLDETTIVVA